MDGSSHILHPLSREAAEDRLLDLADEIAEREGIPIEAAWSIVSRHLTGNAQGDA